MKYDFESENTSSESSQPEDPRTGFHITRSCGNCRFYSYDRHKQRRGWCKLPLGEKATLEQAIEKGHKTHTTCLCDEHKYRPIGLSVETIQKWTEDKVTITDEMDS